MPLHSMNLNSFSKKSINPFTHHENITQLNLFNEDFKDYIALLNHYGVDYMLVGGYAVVIRGYSRTTGDLDIWVDKERVNYNNLINVNIAFGLPKEAVPEEKFFSEEFDVFTFGRPPYAIEIMTAVKGLEFKECMKHATIEHIDGLPVKVIHLNQLKVAKSSAARHKDLNDLENLPN